MDMNTRKAGLLLIFIICLGMTFFMTFFILLVNAGFIEGFFHAWMKMWLTAFLVGLPVAYFIVPAAKKMISRL